MDTAEKNSNTYANALEAIQDAKLLVKLWLKRHLLLYYERYIKPEEGYNDLYVDRREVNAFLKGTLGEETELQGALSEINKSEEILRETINLRSCRTMESEGSVPFEDLRAAFGISDDILLDVIMALLVVEIDPEFIRAYGHAWCDFTRQHVEIRFLIELVARTSEERDLLCQFFLARNHSLFTLRAMEIYLPFNQTNLTLMQRAIRLDDRIVQFLCGHKIPPREITGIRGKLLQGKRSFNNVLISEEIKTAFLKAFGLVLGRTAHNRLYVFGPSGTGKSSICHAAANSMNRPLLVGDCGDFPVNQDLCCEYLWSFLREAHLHNAIVLLKRVESIWTPRPREEPEKESQFRALEMVCADYPGPLLLSGTQRIPPLVDRLSGLLTVQFSNPTAKVQKKFWQLYLPPAIRFEEDFGIDEIVERYSLTGGTIKKVAKVLGASKNKRSLILGQGFVFSIIREHLSHGLGTLAAPVDRGYAWNDLVVPERTHRTLQEIVSFVRNREKIVASWGIGLKSGEGTGVAALFFGPPGTGKTMSASIIATDLGMEIYQIDLSQIIDKYIGETEKNFWARD